MLLSEAAVLRRCWYAVALAGAVGDAPVAREVLGTRVVLWRGPDGEALAALDRCPHRLARLSAGWSAEGCLVCPYHGWAFGPDGRARHIPQLDPGLPVPPRASLTTVACREHLGAVWVCLDPDPLDTLPDVPELATPGWRLIPEYEWEFACSAAHLVENNFDPSHIAFVHRATFGTTTRPRVDVGVVERTAAGLRTTTVVPVEGRHGEDGATERRVTADLHLPFVGVFRMAYPDGLVHVMVKACTPVDDGHTRLVQLVLRNDTEADVPAADILAFDEAVEAEDAALLASLPWDYELDVTQLVHLRVDRASIEMRRLWRDVIEGTWVPGEGFVCTT